MSSNLKLSNLAWLMFQITVLHGLPVAPTTKKALHPLGTVAIMRVATRVSRGKLYKLEREKRSMWNVMKGSEHEKTDCANSRLFRKTYDYVGNRRSRF